MIKLIKLLYEQLLFKKAMNRLARQTWSTDYIIYLLRKSQLTDITMRIREPDGRVLEIITNTSQPTTESTDYFKREQALTQDEWDYMLGLTPAHSAGA